MQMSITAIVAERIPEMIEKAVEGGKGLIIAPNPAASGLPIVQSIIGLTCAACLSLALLGLNRYGRLNTPPEI